MYSAKASALLKRKGIVPGGAIAIEKEGRRYEGVLMPSTDSSDPGNLIIKLSSGYNIGIALEGAAISRPAGAGGGPAAGMGKQAGCDLKAKSDPSKPLLSILTTGGTITSRVDYKTGGVTALMSPEEMLCNIPELAGIARLRMENPFRIMSESMTAAHWQKLAAAVASALRRSEGVIVTHGTDTLHFTAAALSFMLRDLGKPVVLVGSQRSADRGSSDGPFNLICASRVALSDMAAVGICMHGSSSDDHCIFTRGTKVRKMHTSRRDAFRPVNDLPLAKVWPDGRIEKMQEVARRSPGSAKVDSAFEEKVALVKTYPGASPGIVDYYAGNGYRGLVLEVTGLGQVPTYGKNSWLPAIRRAVDKGVVVCGAAGTIYGRLNPNVYAEGRLAQEAGLLYLQDMLAETAYVKLGWVLGHTKSPAKAGEMMLADYAGEISDRSLPGTFLI